MGFIIDIFHDKGFFNGNIICLNISDWYLVNKLCNYVGLDGGTYVTL